MKKKVFLFLLLGILFVFGIIKLTQVEEDSDSNELHALNVELESLRVEKNNIEREIGRLQVEYNTLITGKGNIILMVKDVDNQLYTTIKNQLSKREMVGTILLSKEEFPGNKGCMTMEQFREMIDMGWTYCINWQADEEKEDWLGYWSEKLTSNGLNMPTAIHFEKDAYSKELDSFLSENGFEVLIQQDIDGKVAIVETCEEEPWNICTVPWNEPGVKGLMQQAEANGGTIVFAVGSQKDTEQYKEQVFDSMISTLKDYVAGERILITDVISAKEYEKVPLETSDEAIGLEKEMDELEERLKEVETRMDELYEQFREINN